MQFLAKCFLRRDSAPALGISVFGLTWLNSVESLYIEDSIMNLQREAKDTQLEQWAPGGVRLGDASLRLMARWLCFCADSLLSACFKSLLAMN